MCVFTPAYENMLVPHLVARRDEMLAALAVRFPAVAGHNMLLGEADAKVLRRAACLTGNSRSGQTMQLQCGSRSEVIQISVDYPPNFTLSVAAHHTVYSPEVETALAPALAVLAQWHTLINVFRVLNRSLDDGATLTFFMPWVRDVIRQTLRPHDDGKTEREAFNATFPDNFSKPGPTPTYLDWGMMCHRTPRGQNAPSIRAFNCAAARAAMYGKPKGLPVMTRAQVAFIKDCAEVLPLHDMVVSAAPHEDDGGTIAISVDGPISIDEDEDLVKPLCEPGYGFSWAPYQKYSHGFSEDDDF
jgi:hypothetical protein